MSVANCISRLIDKLYVKPFAKIFSPQIFRYAACGGANMVLDVVWYFLVYHYLVAKQFVVVGDVVISPHVATLFVVFPITFLTGFWLNRNVVFCAVHYSGWRQIVRYALSVVGSLLLNYLCIKFFVEVCGVWPTPAKALTTAVTVSYSYVAGRYFTFRKRDA